MAITTINLTIPVSGTSPGNIPAIGSTLGASQLVVTDVQGKLATSGVTATEAGYLAGTSGVIQTQITARLIAANNLSDLASAATARTNLGLVIGTDVAAIADVYFTLIVNTGVSNPSDATTYYCNTSRNFVPTVTATDQQINIGYKCVLIGAIINAASGTPGTSEASTLKLRNITQATSSTIGTFTTNATNPVTTTATHTGLNIALAATDFFTTEWLTPTWVTNPLSAFYTATLIFKRTL